MTAADTWKNGAQRVHVPGCPLLHGQNAAMCREKGISVILYSAPSPNNYNYAKHNTLTDYAEQNGAEYLDFNLMTEELGD